MNIKFPTCWDGVNLEAKEGVEHVVYSDGCATMEDNGFDECFDFDCPSSHPFKMPEIHLYVRVLNYEGGAHVFADGSDVSRKVNQSQSFVFMVFSHGIANTGASQ